METGGSMDWIGLAREFGLPVAMLLSVIWALYKKMLVPSWYSEYLERQLNTAVAKNEELEKKVWELTGLAHKAVAVGKALAEKEESRL